MAASQSELMLIGNSSPGGSANCGNRGSGTLLWVVTPSEVRSSGRVRFTSRSGVTPYVTLGERM